MKKSDNILTLLIKYCLYLIIPSPDNILTMIAELEKIEYNDGGGFQASFISDSGGFWHFHPEYELVLNMKSNGSRIIGDSVELFDHYDMTLVAGNVPHCWNYYRSQESLPEKHGIMVHFSLSSLGEPFLSQYEMHAVRELLKDAEMGIAFSLEDAREAEKHLMNMVESKGIDKMIEFFCVLRILCNSGKRALLSSGNYRQNFDEKGNKRMNNVYNYIRENYSGPITLETVSGIARMSPFAFSRYFKKNSGAGFVEYLNRVRTNKACYLLRETDSHINGIASECGFTSISNFNKQFRKTEGLSPREYRAQYR